MTALRHSASIRALCLVIIRSTRTGTDSLLTRRRNGTSASSDFTSPVGNLTGTFGLETNSDPSTVTLTGYPAGFDGDYGPRMMNDSIAVSVDDNFWTFDYATAGPGRGDILPGDLGAPLWLEGHGSIHVGNNGPYIVGVNSTYGWAADVTYSINQLMAWIDGNNYLVPVEVVDQVNLIGHNSAIDAIHNLLG